MTDKNFDEFRNFLERELDSLQPKKEMIEKLLELNCYISEDQIDSDWEFEDGIPNLRDYTSPPNDKYPCAISFMEEGGSEEDACTAYGPSLEAVRQAIDAYCEWRDWGGCDDVEQKIEDTSQLGRCVAVCTVHRYYKDLSDLEKAAVDAGDVVEHKGVQVYKAFAPKEMCGILPNFEEEETCYVTGLGSDDYFRAAEVKKLPDFDPKNYSERGEVYKEYLIKKVK